ncbi:MAG: hypothetical protein U0531_13040 [Dehalococcoidia bacterium]
MTPSAGLTPFGFAADSRRRLLVSGRRQHCPRIVDRNGGVTLRSSAVANGQVAACWAVETENGRFVYTANAGTGTISGYVIAADRSVSLLDRTA